jgi:hypothetical protein
LCEMGKSRNPQCPEIAGMSQTHLSKIPCWTLVSWISTPPEPSTLHQHSEPGSSHPIVVQIVVPPWLRPGKGLSAEWMPMQLFAEVSPTCTGDSMGFPQLSVMDAYWVRIPYSPGAGAPSPGRTLSEALPNPGLSPCDEPVFFSALRVPESC